LIELSRAGDQDAFGELVVKHRDRIHRLVFGLLRESS